MSDEADVDTQQAVAVTGVAHRSSEELRKDILAASGVFLFAFALYLLPAIQSRPLSETPEARVAVVAREMVQNDRWVLPTMGGEPRLNKPPLPYWLTAASAKVLAGSDGLTQKVMTSATLLPPALLMALALFIVVLYGALVFGRAAGIISGLLLGLGLLVTRFAQMGFGDSTLLFTTTWMLCSAAWLITTPRPGVLTALSLGVSLGLGILTKGHVPVVVLMAPVLVAVARYRRFNGRKVALFAVALAVAATSLWWFFAVSKEAPQAWATLANEAKDALSSHMAHKQDDRWIFYFYKTLEGALPWTPLLLAAWVIYLTRPAPKTPEDVSGIQLTAVENMRFFAFAFIAGFACFYSVPKQQSHYLLPLMPSLALASGYMLSQFRAPGGFCEERLAWAQLAIGVLAACTVASFPLWPLEKMAQTEASTEEFSAFMNATGFLVSIPLALFVLVVCFVAARQWVEGKPLLGATVLGVVMYLALAGWSVHWARATGKQMVLNTEAPNLRAELEKKSGELGKDFSLYHVKGKEELLTFYLNHAVKSENDLIAEDTGKTGNDARRRVLVFARKNLPVVEKDYDLAIPGSVIKGTDAFVLLTLPADRDWPAEIAPKLKARREADR